jgi:hypothetical protein
MRQSPFLPSYDGKPTAAVQKRTLLKFKLMRRYAIRRPRDTPIWKLEAALKCRSCRTPRYSPRVHMIKLTERQEISPYKWVHPDDEDRR